MKINSNLESLLDSSILAFSGTSLYPAERGFQTLLFYSNMLNKDLVLLKENNADIESYISKFKSLLKEYFDSRSKCFSKKVVGQINFSLIMFNVAKAKTNLTLQAFNSWRSEKIKVVLAPSNIIVKGEPDSLNKLKQRLLSLESTHQMMLQINRIVRKRNMTKEEKIETICNSFSSVTRDYALQLLTPDFSGNIAFSTYTLSNSKASINRLKKDISLEDSRLLKYSKGNIEYYYDYIRVLENFELNRLQVFFPDDNKPSKDFCTTLKQNGFRFSGKHRAWQRQLTDNAIVATKELLSLYFINLKNAC